MKRKSLSSTFDFGFLICFAMGSVPNLLNYFLVLPLHSLLSLEAFSNTSRPVIERDVRCDFKIMPSNRRLNTTNRVASQSKLYPVSHTYIFVIPLSMIRLVIFAILFGCPIFHHLNKTSLYLLSFGHLLSFNYLDTYRQSDIQKSTKYPSDDGFVYNVCYSFESAHIYCIS